MKTTVGIIALAILSLALGVLLGELNYRFYARVLPPAAMGQVSLVWVHSTCLFYGLGVGVLFFVWGMIASSVTRLFGQRPAHRS